MVAVFYPADWFDTIRPAFVWWVRAELNGEPGPNPTGIGSRANEQWTVGLAQQDGEGREASMPKRPAAVITFLDVVQVEGRQTRRTADNPTNPATQADHFVEGAGRGVVEVQLFSACDERQALASLRASLCRGFPTRDTLRSAGVVLLESQAIERDLSEVFAEASEFRYALEVPFRVSRQRETQNYPWIETVTAPVIGVT